MRSLILGSLPWLSLGCSERVIRIEGDSTATTDPGDGVLDPEESEGSSAAAPNSGTGDSATPGETTTLGAVEGGPSGDETTTGGGEEPASTVTSTTGAPSSTGQDECGNDVCSEGASPDCWAEPGHIIVPRPSPEIGWTCEPCPRGTYSELANQTACLTCPPETFSANEGAAACTPWGPECETWVELPAIAPTDDRRCSDFLYLGDTGFVSQLATDGQGNIYVRQSTSLSKVGAAGEIEWLRDLGPAVDMAVDDAGTTYLVGGNLIQAVDSAGTVTWTHELGRSELTQITVDADGAVVVSGTSDGLFLARFDGYREEVWSQQFDVSTLQEVVAMAGDPQRGTLFSYRASTYAGESSFSLVALDSQGELRWERNLEIEVTTNAVAVAPSGDVYVAGRTRDDSRSGVVQQFDTEGNSQWSAQVFDPEEGGQIAALGIDERGDVHVAHLTYGGPGTGRSFAATLSPIGEMLAEYPVGGFDVDASSLAVDSSGHLFVGGGGPPKSSGVNGKTEAFVLRVRSEPPP